VSTSLPIESAAPNEAGPETSGAELAVLGFDHIVLRVNDVERSLRFYVGTLGLQPTRVEEWRAGTVPFPSVRIDPGTVIDLDGRRAPDGANVEHFCLEVATTDLAAVAGRDDLVVLGGPVRRWGARGEADLIYIADPDGHMIELRHYGPTQGFGYHGV
jgi:catechol 2,3-dioxygenase-like lactoylglutathione lyase family enzyme